MTTSTILHSLKQHSLLWSVIILLLLPIPLPSVIEWLSLRINISLAELLQQPWRLLTAHWVHASWPHLLTNLANVFILGLVFLSWPPKKLTLSFLLFTSLFISLALWLKGGITSYVGFSGIFHGLLVWLLLYYRNRAPVLYGVVIAIIIAKIIVEQWFGASSELEKFIGISVAIDAHLLGVMAAIIFWLATHYFLARQ